MIFLVVPTKKNKDIIPPGIKLFNANFLLVVKLILQFGKTEQRYISHL